MEPGPIATRVFLRTLSNDNAPRSMAIYVESGIADTEAILQWSSSKYPSYGRECGVRLPLATRQWLKSFEDCGFAVEEATNMARSSTSKDARVSFRFNGRPPPLPKVGIYKHA
jgi:hypothetical protein